jgi:hypothetical protein
VIWLGPFADDVLTAQGSEFVVGDSSDAAEQVRE